MNNLLTMWIFLCSEKWNKLSIKYTLEKRSEQRKSNPLEEEGKDEDNWEVSEFWYDSNKHNI